MDNFEFFEKQKIYIKQVLSGKYTKLLFGGGVGGGKTFTTLPIAYQLAMDYPGIRVGILRKNLTTIRRNTVPSIQKMLNMLDDNTQLNKSDWTYNFANGSQFILVEADDTKDPEFNKLKGLEVTIWVMEEVTELAKKAFDMAITRCGRWLNTKGGKYEEIPPLCLMTCNPEDTGWVKDTFYEPWEKGIIPYKEGQDENKLDKNLPYCFVQSLPCDNPYNSEAYLKSLEMLPEDIYKQLVLGNWNYSSEPNRIHKMQDLKNAIVPYNELLLPEYIGIDAGRSGDDPSIICLGSQRVVLKYFKFISNIKNEAVKFIIHLMEQYKIPPHKVACDSIGNGAGIINPLHLAGYKIKEFCASESPSGKTELKFFKFRNKRIEAAWLLAEDIKNGNLDLSNHQTCDNFIKEAVYIKYLVDDKYVTLEKKDDIKARLGHSPDYYDSTKIMNYVRNGLLGGNITFDYVNYTSKGSKSFVKEMNY